MSALPDGAQALAPGCALVRAARALEKERRCGQTGRCGGGSARHGNGGTAGAAVVRAAVRSGDPWDRGHPPAVAAAGAKAGTRPAQGVRDRRCGTAGPPGRDRGGCECAAQGARGAAAEYRVRADGGRAGRAVADDSVSRSAGSSGETCRQHRGSVRSAGAGRHRTTCCRATGCSCRREHRQGPCRRGATGPGWGGGGAVRRGRESRTGGSLRLRARPAAVPGARRIHRDARRPARATARASPVGRGDREGNSGDRAGARSPDARPGQPEPAAGRGRTGQRLGDGGMKLSHVDEAGRARMVDVGEKPVTVRTAVAEGAIRMSREAFRLVAEQQVAKGDVLGVSEVAGTLAAKRTAELIPLCHPVGLDHVEVEATLEEGLPGVRVRAAAKAVGRTGVEMEALTAVSVALLTVYDMVKAADRGMVIEKVRLLEKTGGTHGDWRRDAAD